MQGTAPGKAASVNCVHNRDCSLGIMGTHLFPWNAGPVPVSLGEPQPAVDKVSRTLPTRRLRESVDQPAPAPGRQTRGRVGRHGWATSSVQAVSMAGPHGQQLR